jgi:hypothetical protein
VVARSADALHGRGDRRRRADLQDQVDVAHVDAELERGGGDDAPQLAGLQRLLGDPPFGGAHRPVVRAGEDGGQPERRARLCRHRRRPRGALGRRARAALTAVVLLVDLCRQPLREPPRAGEDDRRPVREDLVHDRGRHVRPDRRPLVPDDVARLRGYRARGRARVRQARGGQHDRQVETTRRGRGDDADRPAAVVGGPCAREGGSDGLCRPDGGREADALDRAGGQGVEPLEAEEEVGAALRARDGVHLVDDHGLHAREGLSGARGEHEVERLGRGDEDVRRAGEQAAPFRGRGVPAAHAHADVRNVQAELGRGGLDAGEREAQVALDVRAERLERGDVEDARAALLRGREAGRHVVERPEEGGEGLAGARGGHDERVLARRRRFPRPRLRRRGGREGAGEPAGGRGAEREVVGRGGGAGGPIGGRLRRHGSIVAPTTHDRRGQVRVSGWGVGFLSA